MICLGLDNFCRDLEFMLGLRPSIYWKLCWGIITPIFLLCILFYRIATLEPITYNGGKMYPDIAYGKFNQALKINIPS
jgi:solute carrier family 6 amino acid transporter-like protein 5/7/9/14